MSKLREYDQVTSTAFEFLKTRYGYSDSPAIAGHYPASFSKTYHQGERRVVFFCDADHRDRFGLSFQPVDFEGRHHKRIRRYYRLYDYSLRRLLRILGIDEELPKDGPIPEAVEFIARAAQEFAHDQLSGDLSAFAPLVYLLEIAAPGHPSDNRTNGVFSSIEKAERAAENIPDYAIQPNMKFNVFCREIDLDASW